jgi:hypothetical protein
MVRIFKDGKPNYMVQTTCLDADSFVSDLSEAMAQLMNGSQDDNAIAIMQVLGHAMPIMFRLSGYKSDTVTEQRTLVSGFISPSESSVIATAGK